MNVIFDFADLNFIDENIVFEIYQSKKLNKDSIVRIILNQNGCTIGDNAFKDYTGIKEVWYIEKAILGNYCFQNTGITEILLSEANTFGIGCFKDCHSLQKVILPNSENTELTESLFENCIMLNDIWYVHMVKTFGKNVFKGCSSINFIQLSQNKNVIIKESAFENCTSLTSIWYIEDAQLDKFAFKNSSLNEVTLYNNIIIPEGCFENCTSLNTVKLNTSQQCSIQKNAFKNCTSLNDVWYIENVSKIDEYAFYNCYSYSNVMKVINASYIGTNAFEGIPTLWDSPENLNFNKDMLWLKNDVTKHVISEDPYQIVYFDSNMPMLKFGTAEDEYSGELMEEQVQNEIPKHTYVDENGNIQTLTPYDPFKVIFGQNISKIGDYAFRNCSGLQEANIEVVPYYGTGAFQNCYGLKSIAVKEESQIPYRMFENCSKLTSIGNIEKVIAIEDEAFIGSNVKFSKFESNSLTSLGANVFNGQTSLTSINIPNCTKLDPNALNAIGEPDLSGKYNYKITFNVQA